MGRPVNKEILGTAVNNEAKALIIDSAYIPGNSSVSSKVSIVKQKGTRTFEVTDGMIYGTVALVDKTDPASLVSGEAISKVSINVAGTTEYTPASIVILNGGSGYKGGDVLTVGTAGTITVNSVSDGSQGAITQGAMNLASGYLDTNPSGTNIPENNSTSVSGVGATFDIVATPVTTYTPTSITLNAAGTGYAVGDTINLPDAGIVTVATVTDGAIATITVALGAESETNTNNSAATGTTSGSGTGATFTVVASSASKFKLNSVQLNSPGRNYKVNDKITVGDCGTYTVQAVTPLTGQGIIESYSVNLSTTPSATDMSGTGIVGTGGTGTGATFTVTSSVSGSENTEHARTIHNRTVQTWEGNVYPWDVNGSTTIGHANLTTKAS